MQNRQADYYHLTPERVRFLIDDRRWSLARVCAEYLPLSLVVAERLLRQGRAEQRKRGY